MKSVSFRIRRQYFDDIVSGKKKVELRKLSSFWKNRLLRCHSDDRPDVAVFVCGKDVHRREITFIGIGSAEHFLGRKPSEQGIKDIGDAVSVIAIGLGKEMEQK